MEAGGVTGGGDRGRGDNVGTANVDELEVEYDDWSMQVMKWQDEASKGAKEARAISGKGESLSAASLRQLEDVA
jgi:hypothetical protein